MVIVTGWAAGEPAPRRLDDVITLTPRVSRLIGNRCTGARDESSMITAAAWRNTS
jgi:hypothetical protein